MKVLFLQNVAKVGNKGEIKDVNQGYANNFLLPRKLAQVVSEKNEAQIRKEQSQRLEMDQVNQELFKKSIDSLNKQKVILKEKSNEQGHLFSQVHKDEIQKAISSQYKLDLNEILISIEEPIKAVGEFDVVVGDKNTKATIKVVVEAL